MLSAQFQRVRFVSLRNIYDAGERACACSALVQICGQARGCTNAQLNGLATSRQECEHVPQSSSAGKCCTGSSPPGLSSRLHRRRLGIMPQPSQTTPRPGLRPAGSHAGTAVTTKPTPAMMGGMEASNAQKVLLAEPGAVAAYDLVPCKAASAVFTMDTSTDIFLLHTLQVQQVEEHVVASAYKELDWDNTTYVCTRRHYVCCQHGVRR